MSRLIDANDLYEKTAEWEAQALHLCKVHANDEDPAEWRRWTTILTERTAFKHDIADAPTVDAEPVVYGEWIVHNPDNPLTIYGECPFCHEEVGRKYNYCPNCGADMRGGQDE